MFHLISKAGNLSQILIDINKSHVDIIMLHADINKWHVNIGNLDSVKKMARGRGCQLVRNGGGDGRTFTLTFQVIELQC